MKIFTVPFRFLLPVLLSIPAFPGRDHLPLVTQDQQHTPGKVPWEGRGGGKGESGQVSADGAVASGISPSEAIIIQSNINGAKRTKVPMQFNAPEMRCRTPPQRETQQSLLKPRST